MIEISALFCARHKEVNIVKLQKVSLSTVKWETNRLNSNENLTDRLNVRMFNKPFYGIRH